jgi:hypothetical protein
LSICRSRRNLLYVGKKVPSVDDGQLILEGTAEFGDVTGDESVSKGVDSSVNDAVNYNDGTANQ